MTILTLFSPLKGWVTPLSDVPDAVFSSLMLGDGIAVDPLGDVLVAPCDGTIISVHAARHAIAMRAQNGIELLIHLGIDSVAMGGEAIEALVSEGDEVKVGQSLLRFDIDRLVMGASAAVTPLLVTGGTDVAPEILSEGLVDIGFPLLRVTGTSGQAEAVHESGNVVTQPVVLALPHGIHARPAARIVDAVRDLAAKVTLIHGEKRAAASSALALLGLGAQAQDTLLVEAVGVDANLAIERVAAVLTDDSEAVAVKAVQAPVLQMAISDDIAPLSGIAASPGLATGTAFWISKVDVSDLKAIGSPAEERTRLDQALSKIRLRLTEQASASGAAGEILGAHLTIVDDPALLETAHQAIVAGKSAGEAWHDAIAAQIDVLGGAASGRIAERVDDLRDIEGRVLGILSGKEVTALDIPPGSIVLAQELLPSEVVALDPNHVEGIALSLGGPTSHAAILAAGMGIPMVVALGDALTPIEAGETLLLDADQGRLEVAPTPERINAAHELIANRKETLAKVSAQLCHSVDGVRIRISANLGSVADALSAVQENTEGCGLLRTEFLFLEREQPPSEDEQLAVYQLISDTLGDRPLTIRLLDIGGDKPVPYLPIATEENPMLGMRGVRVSLAHMDLLESQLAAILRVQPPGRCKIMVPMVANENEVAAIAETLDRLVAARKDVENVEKPNLGIMVETPAAALIAGTLAKTANFFSIGSNDLTQYTLAMDRGNAAIAGGADGLHPAVLKLIAEACSGAAEARIPVSVCGGLAADRLAVPILLGLGVTELSVPPKLIGPTKLLTSSLSIADCRAFAHKVLTLGSAADVRKHSASFLEGRA